jgi:hypothetical protein
LECVNKQIPLRTHKEYCKDNKDKVSKQKQQYYNDNKDKLTQCHKQHYTDHKDKIKERHKQHYNNKLSDKIQCDCGGHYVIKGKIRHENFTYQYYYG